MRTTLATKYTVTVDPASDTPWTAGSIISEDPNGDQVTICVWGNGVPLEQAMNGSDAVIAWTENGSITAALGSRGSVPLVIGGSL